MPASNTYGRQVVIPLTNKSGGGVIAGDVVIVDTSNNDAFTTTTTAGFTGLVGVAQETIASNATGRVLVSGYAALVNVNASVTRGQYGKTHTVAKQATGTASRGAGTFCQWLTGGTTPDAVVYPVDLLGSSLTNPMTTTGDTIYSSDNSGTPARAAKLVSARSVYTGGDYTTKNSTTFADLDATNLNLSLTTGAHRVLIGVTAVVAIDTASQSICLDVLLDAARIGQTFGIVAVDATVTAKAYNLSFTYLTAALSAGAHTFKIQYRVTGSSATFYASTGVTPFTFWAMEQPI